MRGKPRQRFVVDVSLENSSGPVKAYHGEIFVANARQGVRRALERALYAHPGAQWHSCVVVLERLDEPKA
jgi:hypothetical protein